MRDVDREVINRYVVSKMTALYRPPQGSSDPTKALEIYFDRLNRFKADELKEGFERLVDRYTLKTWPSVAEIVQACGEIRRHREVVSAPRRDPERPERKPETPESKAQFEAVFQMLEKQQRDGQDFEWKGVTYNRSAGNMLYPMAKAMHDNWAVR